jgi:hypothetical protein
MDYSNCILQANKFTLFKIGSEGRTRIRMFIIY